MITDKETETLFVGHCPQFQGGLDEIHEALMTYKDETSLYEYIKDLFAPSEFAGEK